ncbi:MAG TPA: hypothetical protein VK668_06055 [Mucilaginibacter sp.]|nr:hypothetical protein [Mucilaginibacter sp.]
MTKNYLTYKEGKKKFAQKGVLLLIVLAIIFATVLVRFAISDTRFDFLKTTPDSDDAYSIAKQFIKPTIKFSPVYFPETGYQCAQKPDSVFIIKSYAESKSQSGAKNQSGTKNVTTFEITIKYNGGKVASKESWTMLNLSEN